MTSKYVVSLSFHMDVPGDTVMADNSTSGKASENNAKATLRRVAEQLLTLANRGGLYCRWFLAGACF